MQTYAKRKARNKGLYYENGIVAVARPTETEIKSNRKGEQKKNEIG